MNASGPRSDELERRLAELHDASYGWACSCCDWNETEAEDVLQTAYVKVISGRARYGGRSAFRTWLFGVIRNTAREFRRKAESRRLGAERLAANVEPPSGEQPMDSLESAERARVLRAALEELPGRQRQVLHLVFYQDLTIQEAADVLEVSVGAARVHYDRGKKKLRALLSPSTESGGLIL